MAVSKPLQLLSCFYYKNVCSFIELCNAGEYSSDLGGYYIRQLIHDGYVEKIDRGQYQILPKGKHFLVANTEKLAMNHQARMSVALVVQKDDKFIATHRTAQPFIGRVEWPTGSVKPGESIESAAKRITLGRLGSVPELKFLGFFRRIDMYNDEVFDDKLFAVHKGILSDGDALAEKNKVGTNKLYSTDELYKVKLPSKSLLDILHYASQDPGGYIEHHYDLQAEDLSIE